MNDSEAENVQPGVLSACRHLQTKMGYVTRDIDRPSGRPAAWDEDMTRGGTAHRLYCRRTLTVLGPDDDIVGPRVCTPARPCFAPAEEAHPGDGPNGA